MHKLGCSVRDIVSKIGRWSWTSALYGLASGQPVGPAMSRLYPAIESLLTDYDYARREYNVLTNEAATIPLRDMVYNKVTAHDRANTVILGDPTAGLPLPPRLFSPEQRHCGRRGGALPNRSGARGRTTVLSYAL